jgi:uncharacterized protein
MFTKNSLSMNHKSIGRFLCTVIITLSYIAFAQGQNSLLWKISGKNLSEPSYLYGTIHIICEEQFRIDDNTKKAMQQTGQLIMEMDMSDPNLMAQMQQLSLNPGFKNIKSDLKPEDAKVMDQFLQEQYGAGLDQLGILKPFVLSSMILMKMLPCEQQASYEMYFTEQAKALNIPTKGLETVAEQVGMFDQIPQQEQLGEIIEMLKENKGMEDFDKMVSAYLDQDISKLYGMITESGMFQKYQDLLLDQRNRSWIPLIESFITEKPGFIAVGSGHLHGNQGVISLLRQAGYQVEPIQ